jgi:hypothetical protein
MRPGADPEPFAEASGQTMSSALLLLVSFILLLTVGFLTHTSKSCKSFLNASVAHTASIQCTMQVVADAAMTMCRRFLRGGLGSWLLFFGAILTLLVLVVLAFGLRWVEIDTAGKMSANDQT